MNGKKFGLIFLGAVALWHGVPLMFAGDGSSLAWFIGLMFLASTLI